MNNKQQTIDGEDLGDLLVNIEENFDIKFADDEFINICTYGELHDHIIDKIRSEHANVEDCTSQQAFYKLRNALVEALGITKNEITPHMSLVSILPRNRRKSQVSDIEKVLGFKLSLLRPLHFVENTFSIMALASFFGIFLSFFFEFSGILIAIIGFVVSIAGLKIAYKTANEIDIETVGELAKTLTRDKYAKSRRNAKTCNYREIGDVLTENICYGLGMEKSELTRNAIIA